MGLGIGTVVSIVGTALSAVGQIQQAQAQKEASQYQAAVARNNKIIAQRKAEDARRRGDIAAQQERLRTRLLIGQQRAGAAARGVEVDLGAAADITADTAMLGELDALTIRTNAEREALGFEAQANQFQSQSDLAEARGQGAETEGFLSAAGTVLGGAGKVADKWYQDDENTQSTSTSSSGNFSYGGAFNRY